MMLLRTGADDRGFMILKRLSAQLLHAMWRDEDPKPDWKRRKQAYLDRLPNEPPATRLISASDKLYNAKAILEDFRCVKHELWKRCLDGWRREPRWRGDGKELFYLSSDGKMMAVPVTTGANFDASSPVALFQATPREPVSNRDLFVYDVSRDGQRFLILTQVKKAETTPMAILNWPAKLNK